MKSLLKRKRQKGRRKIEGSWSRMSRRLCMLCIYIYIQTVSTNNTGNTIYIGVSNTDSLESSRRSMMSILVSVRQMRRSKAWHPSPSLKIWNPKFCSYYQTLDPSLILLLMLMILWVLRSTSVRTEKEVGALTARLVNYRTQLQEALNKDLQDSFFRVTGWVGY